MTHDDIVTRVAASFVTTDKQPFIAMIEVQVDKITTGNLLVIDAEAAASMIKEAEYNEMTNSAFEGAK